MALPASAVEVVPGCRRHESLDRRLSGSVVTKTSLPRGTQGPTTFAPDPRGENVQTLDSRPGLLSAGVTFFRGNDGFLSKGGYFTAGLKLA